MVVIRFQHQFVLVTSCGQYYFAFSGLSAFFNRFWEELRNMKWPRFSSLDGQYGAGIELLVVIRLMQCFNNFWHVKKIVKCLTGF